LGDRVHEATMGLISGDGRMSSGLATLVGAKVVRLCCDTGNRSSCGDRAACKKVRCREAYNNSEQDIGQF
jgi:hypothetical protein